MLITLKNKLIEILKIKDRQAEAILNLRLRALRKLEEQKIRKEYDSLKNEKKDKEYLDNFVYEMSTGGKPYQALKVSQCNF